MRSGAKKKAKENKTEDEEYLEKRFAELERMGVLTRATQPIRDMKPLAHRPGALKRFLRSRD